MEALRKLLAITMRRSTSARMLQRHFSAVHIGRYRAFHLRRSSSIVEELGLKLETTKGKLRRWCSTIWSSRVRTDESCGTCSTTALVCWPPLYGFARPPLDGLAGAAQYNSSFFENGFVSNFVCPRRSN